MAELTGDLAKVQAMQDANWKPASQYWREKVEAMERDHRAINHLMGHILDEVRLIRGNGITAHNIGYHATLAKEWSGRYLNPEAKR